MRNRWVYRLPYHIFKTRKMNVQNRNTMQLLPLCCHCKCFLVYTGSCCKISLTIRGAISTPYSRARKCIELITYQSFFHIGFIYSFFNEVGTGFVIRPKICSTCTISISNLLLKPGIENMDCWHILQRM